MDHEAHHWEALDERHLLQSSIYTHCMLHLACGDAGLSSSQIFTNLMLTDALCYWMSCSRA